MLTVFAFTLLGSLVAMKEGFLPRIFKKCCAVRVPEAVKRRIAL
jgi:hypothetical protein